ncbi:MAG: metallophosphoesterase [Bacilli bacterium]
MKKIFKFLLLFFIAYTITTFSLKVQAADGPIMVIVNPGEDSSTMMNISYHTSLENTVIQYYEAPSGSAQMIMPECRATPFTENNNYQCFATLTNLKPDTTYNYYILGYSSYVERSFKTAGADEFSFVHVTDIHSYRSGASNTRVATANKVLNTINQIKDFDFTLMSGDVTAYGTVYEQWETLYGMDVLKSKMTAITPGNHDYYNTSAAVVSIDYFNSVLNNPKNGADGVLNSTYYFKYGNTLFISLNSEEAANNSTLRANQIKWLNEVTANNPSDFIVVFTHRPFYTGDNLNAGQASDMRTYFQEIFDKTGVDLVLGGHNHVYARTNHVYQNNKVLETNPKYPYLGTVYLTGIQIGDRYKTEPGTKPSIVEVAHVGAGQDGGSLITVNQDKITIEFIKHDGTRLYPYEILNKSKVINKQSIESSVEVSKTNDTINIDYSQNTLVGSVKKVNVYDENKTLLKTFLNPTNHLEIENGPKVGRYNLEVEMFLRNGEVINKNVVAIDSRYDFGTVFDFETVEEELYTNLTWKADVLKDKFVRYEIYANGSKLKEVSKDATSTVLDKISPYKENDISFRVIGDNNSILYQYDFVYGENANDIHVVFNIEKLRLKEGDEKDLEITVFPEQDVKLEFVSSDPNVATVDENGKVTAIGEGTCTISLNVAKRWDVKSEIEITVEASPVKDPTPPTKKGCFQGGSIFVGFAVIGLVVILRRKRF